MEHNQKIFMIGIGGIGMSALAQLYRSRGAEVFGSDRDASPVTEMLEQKGIKVIIGQAAENVPKDAAYVVHSDAVYEDHPERMQAKLLGLPDYSYFEALGKASAGMKTIAVAGTHGKTTTTAMLAKILRDCGKNPTAVIGSVVPEFGSNFLEGDPDLLVVEACEYRDHLLELEPDILVITNLEWDHTDYFKTFEQMQESFRKAVRKVPERGAIVADLSDAGLAAIAGSGAARALSYAGESVPDLAVLGDFNEMNARAAKAAAKAFDPSLDDAAIDRSLASFSGTWRRFEYKGKTEKGSAVYDDYAHHPTAVRKTLAAVRAKFPDARIVVAFHPHLYTRTRDLMDGFAAAFSGADSVTIAPIYPAREAPIDGVTSDALAAKINEHEKEEIARAAATLDETYDVLKSEDDGTSVILTMGAGDIYKIADDLILR